MKKTISLLALATICCMLLSCDPSTYVIEDETLSRVTCVELIQYENTDQKHFVTWVPDQFEELVPFELSRATVLETLPAEKTSAFLEAFSKTYILHTYYAYNSPKDVCLRLRYENGDFLIVWANYAEHSHAGYIGEYASDGSVLSFWGSFSALSEYENLVYEYFAYDLT